MNALRLVSAVALCALLLPADLAHARKAAAPPAAPALRGGSLEALSRPVEGRFARVSSSDLEGDPVLEAGRSLVLGELVGPGVIDRLWIAVEGSDTFWRDIVVRITWEGSDAPAVEAPIGDLFGVGPGARQDLQSAPMSVQAGGRSFTSLWKMPFAKGARIQLDNEGVHATRVLAWEIDWRQTEVGPNPLHFHAVYTQDVEEAGRSALTALRTSGKGHYAGMSLVVQAAEPGNVGSGLVRFTVDGDVRRGAGAEPVIRYFGHVFGAGKVAGPYVGATLAEGSRTKARTSMYRFHVEDPIPFVSSFEIKLDHGADNGRKDRMSAVAYWYQEGVAVPFTKLAASRDRRWAAPSDAELALWKRADELDDAIVDAYRRAALDEALTLLEELVALEVDNAIAHYNLACLYALKNESDRSLHMLSQAVDLGFSELSFARHDPDLASLHQHERFRLLVGLKPGE